LAVSNTRILREIGESILYIASLLGDRPRPIDRYIDYFGDRGTGQATSRR
jgi:hypothetical protein